MQAYPRRRRDIVVSIAAHAGAFARLASDAPIRAAAVRSISRVIGANRDRLA
jgi:serine/threonine-protein kinase HipA